MENQPGLKVLFIGNSHTYYNDLPAIFASMAEKDGIACEVVMIAHGGWFLAQHVQEPDVRFNICHGKYDYVVLQERAHSFGPAEKYFDAVRTLDEWIRGAGSKTVLYMCWACKEEEYRQAEITEANERIAGETGAILAPVGREWWALKRERPELELYDADGAHASRRGSEFAARVIWEAIKENGDLHTTAGKRDRSK